MEYQTNVRIPNMFPLRALIWLLDCSVGILCNIVLLGIPSGRDCFAWIVREIVFTWTPHTKCVAQTAGFVCLDCELDCSDWILRSLAWFHGSILEDDRNARFEHRNLPAPDPAMVKVCKV